MLQRLSLKKFTRFEEIDIPFCPGINVLVGANSTGKTHLLKLGYSFLLTESELAIKSGTKPTKEQTTNILISRIAETFFPPRKSSSISSLVKRQQGARSASVKVWIGNSEKPSWELEFNDKKSSNPTAKRITTSENLSLPIFIPAKEVLSMHKGLRGLYTNGQLSIDRTYVDLCDRLDPSLLIGPNDPKTKPLLEGLSKLIGGKVTKDNTDDFYVKFSNLNVEINLVSEGYRKIATLLYLVGNGSLRKETTLFWDEPEANLNPKLIAGLGKILAEMANAGFQVILATHSLFLMRELQLAIQDTSLLRFLGLSEVEQVIEGKKTKEVQLTVADHYLDLEELASLDAEVEQLNRQS